MNSKNPSANIVDPIDKIVENSNRIHQDTSIFIEENKEIIRNELESISVFIIPKKSNKI